MADGPHVLTSSKTLPRFKAHPLSPLHWTKTRKGVPGMKLREWKGMNRDLVLQILSVPWGFFDICEGTDDFDNPVQYTHKLHQRRGFLLAHQYRWVDYTKYRQAMYSTWIALGLLLRDCLYFESCRGLLVANDDKTVEELFERITTAYRILREQTGYEVVPPLDGRPDPSVQALKLHRGSIKCVTGRGLSPGVGRSLARLHLTEIGEIRPASMQRKLMRNLMPSISRRPNARVWFESTPGESGCPAHTTWLNSMEGKGYFAGVRGRSCFLEWWLDPTCRLPVDENFVRTQEEIEYIASCAGGVGTFPEYAAKDPETGKLIGNALSGSFTPQLEITDEHLMFRRQEMATTFDNSPRQYASKFPHQPLAGWLGSENPQLPEDVLSTLLGSAVVDDTVKYSHDSGLHWMKDGPPDARLVYLLTADPKRPVEGADPAGLCAWELTPDGGCEEVGFWQGGDDPAAFADRILTASRWLRDSAEWYINGDDGQPRLMTPAELLRLEVMSAGDEPLSAVESVTDGCVSVLSMEGYEDVNLFHSRTKRSGHTGWYTSAKLLRDATSFTIKELREGRLIPRSRGTISQSMSWDGANKNKRESDGTGGYHHYERARCLVMAGHVMTVRSFMFPRWRLRPRPEDEDYVPIALRVSSSPPSPFKFNPFKPASSQE